MCEWYLNDGSCLCGEAAEKFLTLKFEKYVELSNEINNVLDICKSLNIVKNESSIIDSIIETGEQLSLIHLHLELLLQKLNTNI